MYLVKLPGEKEQGVTLFETKRGQWTASIDSSETPVSLEIKGRRSDGLFDLFINGELHRLQIKARNGKLVLCDENATVAFDIVHAADLVLADSASVAEEIKSGNETLASPITGIVLDVPVKVGDRVERGAPVVIIEAMKMENAFGAPISGMVSEIHIEAGKTIFVGDPLVSISGENE